MSDRKTLINARLIDPSTLSEMVGSITIEEGLIARIDGPVRGTVIDCSKNYLAPGIVDLGVHICEPGERHKESFRSASLAAAAGGVTSMVTFPNTLPTIDNPELLEFFINRAKTSSIVRVLPTAAITKNCEGKEISELGFLQDKGAIAFTSGLETIKNSKIMLRAFSYAANLEMPYLAHCQEYELTNGCSATSSALATRLGLPAAPSEAEKICLSRDADLAEIAKIHYHACQITTKTGLEKLRNLKEEKKNISAGTSIHHLLFDELEIGNYRTFFKLNPPLRLKEDRQALLDCLNTDLVDTISSFHSPQDEESKRLPYEQAASGAIGLQTLLYASLKLVRDGVISMPMLFRKLALNPSKLLKLKTGQLAEGSPADLIIFDPNIPFSLDRFKLLSKAKNTPFDGYELYGRVLKTLINGKQVYEAKP